MGVVNFKIRFVAETNEVLLHPFYFTILIKECTKPREGIPKDSLVEQAKNKIYPVAKEKGVGFSRRSAEILLDLALRMELLHRDYHWKPKGQVINAIAKFLDRLDLSDRIAYLKYHLEADGGAIIHLMKKVREIGTLERSPFLLERGWESVLKDMVEAYLTEVLEPEQRYKLRQILEGAEKGFTKHTREHRLNPRTETLVDLDILKRDTKNRVTYYPNSINGEDTVKKFTEIFTDLNSLEDALSSDGNFFSLVSNLYGLSNKRINKEKEFKWLSTEIVNVYDLIRDDSFRLASLDALRDIVCINSLVTRKKICEWKDVDDIIQKMHDKSEKDLHYHMDDWGKISYITMTSKHVNKNSKRI